MENENSVIRDENEAPPVARVKHAVVNAQLGSDELPRPIFGALDNSQRIRSVSSASVLGNGIDDADVIPVDEAFVKMREKVLGNDDAMEQDKLAATLFNGGHFVKFGKRGDPRTKFVVCSQDGIVFWSDLTGGKTLTSIRLATVTQVAPGKTTENFRRKCAKDVPEELCLSIVCASRTLDLQAETEDVRNLWVQALRFAVENVQMTGKVCKQPISTTELERKERAYDLALKELQEQLTTTKKVIHMKNEEISEREAKIAQTQQECQSELSKKDDTIRQKEAEIETLQATTTSLNQKIKMIHHERSASRSVHTSSYMELEAKYAALDQARRESEERFAQEKAQLTKIIQDSQKLLAKAKETIHKRQASRADRLASFAALEAEAEELRIRNMELRKEVAAAKAVEEKAVRDIQKAKVVVAVANCEDVDLDKELARVASERSGDMPAGESAEEEEEDEAEEEQKDTVTSNADNGRMASIAEEPAADVAKPSVPVLAVAEVLSPAVWQPDHDSEACVRCYDRFSMFTRRHHCRKCGSLVCDNCSKHRVPVRETGEKVRVCTACAKDI